MPASRDDGGMVTLPFSILNDEKNADPCTTCRLSTDATTPCLRQMGLPAHEIAHAIGMVHEHLRHDRDNQVTVFDDNIYTWYWNNFEKLDSDALVTGGLPYDKGSLMHYGPKVRGSQTLESVKRSV